jgi:hypothetical protein
MYVCVCVYVYDFMHTQWTFVTVKNMVNTCMYVCMYACVCVCMSIRFYAYSPDIRHCDEYVQYMYVYMYVCMYACVCKKSTVLCMHMHAYIHMQVSLKRSFFFKTANANFRVCTCIYIEV